MLGRQPNLNLGEKVNYGGSYKREGRISFSSILLLVIFVSAAALIVAAIIWRPWFTEDTPIVGAQPTATATAEGSVQEAPIATVDPNATLAP
jgi:hypothetical protein